MDVFQVLPSNSVHICLVSCENQKKSAKTSECFFVDIHKSGSSLGAISKCLKIPRSSVQTIVHKYKHHGTTQPSYRSGRRRVLSPRDERTLVRKVQINPRQTDRERESEISRQREDTVLPLDGDVAQSSVCHRFGPSSPHPNFALPTLLHTP